VKQGKNNPSYTGVTRAFGRFRQHYWRTETLLNAAISGLEEDRKPLEGLAEKFSGVKAPRGKIPKDYKPSIETTKDKGGKLEVSLDLRTAAIFKKAVLKQLGAHKQLHYHHYSILTVSIWGSFETYIYMLFEELYEKQPLMLRTSEQITYSEAISHKGNIRKYLAEKSLEKVGRFTLLDTLSYLSEKINFKYTGWRKRSLEDIYLMRNIIAHNSGILRSGQEKQLPQGVTTKDGELRISKSYLKRIHSSVKASITLLEKHVEKKFYQPKA
jgi:hypothetical protein